MPGLMGVWPVSSVKWKVQIYANDVRLRIRVTCAGVFMSCVWSARSSLLMRSTRVGLLSTLNARVPRGRNTHHERPGYIFLALARCLACEAVISSNLSHSHGG